ncbi:MAG: NRDE family protein [Burkholderiaceae bacterium]
MCLIGLAWHSHPDYPLIVVGNRDEFYARRTRAAAWWGQAISLLAGRDEEAGGTWMGITRAGRFAALTNVRAPTGRNPHAASRGELVLSALQAKEPAANWLASQTPRLPGFNGFNLLVGDIWPTAETDPALLYHSNRCESGSRVLAPGVYGVSNGLLDTPWPKLTQAVGRMSLQIAQKVDAEKLMAIFSDRRRARVSELPSTGVAADWEHALSAIQIRAKGYGTRSTTVITVRADGLVNFIERSFDPLDPDSHTDRHYEFSLARQAPVPEPRDAF